VSIVPMRIEPAIEPAGAGYQPGACNIGPHEIRRRRVTGLLGMGAAVALGIALVATDASSVLRLAVFFPLAGGLVGWLQARRRFCVAYAYAGVANLGDDDTSRISVAGEETRRADRAASRRLIRDAALIAAPIAAAFALLPL
jgi:hypothetical protein